MKRLFILLAIPLIFACKKKIQKHAGHIQLEAAVYNDPTNDLYNSQLLPVSDLYFMGERFIEKIDYHTDSLNIPKFGLIENGKVILANTLDELSSSNHTLDVPEKKYGALFSLPPVPDYERREAMNDTTFDGYNYKRVRIVTDSAYTVFYIHQTDTILPFSLAPQIDNDYKGVLNRIDTYDKMSDRFVSLRMTVTDTIPQSIYNHLKIEEE